MKPVRPTDKRNSKRIVALLTAFMLLCVFFPSNVLAETPEQSEGTAVSTDPVSEPAASVETIPEEAGTNAPAATAEPAPEEAGTDAPAATAEPAPEEDTDAPAATAAPAPDKADTDVPTVSEAPEADASGMQTAETEPETLNGPLTEPTPMPEPSPEATEAPICICLPAPAEDGAHTDPDCPFYTESISALGYITEDGIPVYAEANDASGLLTLLNKNAMITVISDEGDWLNISCETNGEVITGYVRAEYVADAQIDETVPLLSDHALTPVGTDDGSIIEISGLLPENAYIAVETVTPDIARELMDARDDSDIVFAYDIKIMLPAGDDGGEPTEYQPTVPVAVSITPSADKLTEASVEVTHIAEDAKTGETTPQPVENVNTTENGTIEFPADGFSVYIGTVGTGTSLMLTPGDGYNFYSDASCSNVISGSYTVNTSVAAVTIYIKPKPGYTITSVTSANECIYY